MDTNALKDLDGLVDVFRDLPRKTTRYEYRGVVVEVSPSDAMLRPAGLPVSGMMSRTAADPYPERDSARILFPEPAALDLMVHQREPDDVVGSEFADRYEIQSLVPKLAERFLGEALPALLTKLWSRYHIGVRDSFVEISPLDESPDVSAKVIASLIDAILSRPTREVLEPQGVEDSFCFYCGHSVSSSADFCRHCDGDLRPD